MGIREWLTGEWILRKVEAATEYKDAGSYADRFGQTKRKDAAWVLDYSVKEYEAAVERIETIEAKADSLVGYLGAGSGIVSLASLYLNPSLTFETLAANIPALVLMLAAMLAAVIARVPAKIASRPKVRTAIECSEMDSECPQLELAARVAVSCEAITIAVKEKAKLVRNSYWLFALAILWLVGFVIVVNSARLLRLLI